MTTICALLFLTSLAAPATPTPSAAYPLPVTCVSQGFEVFCHSAPATSTPMTFDDNAQILYGEPMDYATEWREWQERHKLPMFTVGTPATYSVIELDPNKICRCECSCENGEIYTIP